MEVIQSAQALNRRILQLRRAGKTIGFVPTMGALHEGHLSLVKQAGKMSDVVVVSIFVNPTQFNDPADLKRYPRESEKDKALLKETQCELLFMPTVEEVYPEPDTRVFDFGPLETVMEGHYRPGHFNGVGQVVSRLFELVIPHMAFFGEKDFQQLAIIRAMVKQLKFDVTIVGVPIVREPDGLAMSSRNANLSSDQRKSAPLIAQTLIKSLNFAGSDSVPQTREFVVGSINNDALLNVEYFEVVNGYSLQPVDKWDQSDYIVGCIAVFAENTRLIDNVVYRQPVKV